MDVAQARNRVYGCQLQDLSNDAHDSYAVLLRCPTTPMFALDFRPQGLGEPWFGLDLSSSFAIMLYGIALDGTLFHPKMSGLSPVAGDGVLVSDRVTRPLYNCSDSCPSASDACRRLIAAWTGRQVIFGPRGSGA